MIVPYLKYLNIAFTSIVILSNTLTFSMISYYSKDQAPYLCLAVCFYYISKIQPKATHMPILF